jgi:hypothetical protein
MRGLYTRKVERSWRLAADRAGVMVVSNGQAASAGPSSFFFLLNSCRGHQETALGAAWSNDGDLVRSGGTTPKSGLFLRAEPRKRFGGNKEQKRIFSI